MITALTMAVAMTGCDKVQEFGKNAKEKGEEVVQNFEDSEVGRGLRNPFTASDIVFQASTRFLYSTDGGVSWSETIQEVPVNQTYYIAIEMQVSQSEETNEEQTVVATIAANGVTGNTDSVTGDISYDFNIVADPEPEKFRVVFECIPLETGRAQVQVVYDDLVSENWDKTGTIRYVEE